MRYFLKSRKLEICVDENGAELCSIKSPNGYEYLWQADKEIWPRHSPVLFPIVGKLKNNCFHFGENKYSLNQHGFARDLLFNCVSESSESLCFELKSNIKTKSIFPFDFSLRIKYDLIGEDLNISYLVINSGTINLFSIGAHPGFNINSNAIDEKNKPYLVFEKEQFTISLIKEGLISTEKKQLQCAQKKLVIHPLLFENDALVFENNQIQKVELVLPEAKKRVTLFCDNWPFFGLWSKSKGEELKFLCLEPWHGRADSENQEYDFSKKPGIIQLQPKKEFKASFKLRFEDFNSFYED